MHLLGGRGSRPGFQACRKRNCSRPTGSGRAAGPLDTLVTHQVEVTLCGVVDPLVHHGARQGIAAPVLVCVG